MRILVTFGTRPEIIKLAPVVRALRERRGVELDVLWTGQHVELAAGLLELFEIEATHNSSAIMSEPGLAGKFGLMAQQIEKLIQAGAFEWILVQGDTATAAAAASAGFMNKIPVAHVEAGLRTHNLYSPWPEEFNRRVITIASTLHFAPTAAAQKNLLNEGISEGVAPVVGNTVVDALLFARRKVRNGYTPVNKDLCKLPKDKKLVLCTLHRRENIGAPLRSILGALAELGRDGDKILVLPVHLNPQVRAEVLHVLGGAPNVYLLPPLQYLDFVHVLDRSWAVVSDSGGVQEEAPTFGLQILITRDTTERPEVIEHGFGRLVGCDRTAIVNGIRGLTAGREKQLLAARNPFGRGDSAEQIASRLLSHDICTSVDRRIFA